MTGFLSDFLTVAWALRYLLVGIVFLLMVALLLDVIGQRNAVRRDASRLLVRNAELRRENAELRGQLALARRQAGRRRPIIAGRVVS